MANTIGPPLDVFQSSGGGGGGGGSGTVTHVTGPLTANQLIIGDGGSDIKPIGTLGTATTVLHGNASGASTYGAVVLTTDVSGILPIANGGTGSGTKNFWDLTTNQTSAGNKTSSGIIQAPFYDAGGLVFHVEAYRPPSGTDTQAIDAAWAAAQAAGGGLVQFPAGGYNYSGTGLVNHSASDQPIVIAGVGASETDLNFVSVSNPECIKFSSLASIGSTINNGQGIRDIKVESTLTTKDIITFNNLEFFECRNVMTYSGKNAINVTECRYGIVSDCYISAYTGAGIKNTAETHGENWFVSSTLIADSSATDFSYSYVHTGTGDGDGPTLIGIGTSGGKGGFLLQHTAATTASLFTFMLNCYADHTYTDHAFRIEATNSSGKVKDVFMEGCWGINHGTNLDGFHYNRAFSCSQIGGVAYANGGGYDISLANGCDYLTIQGVETTGVSSRSISVDSTVQTRMNIDIPGPRDSTSILCNDYSKIQGRFVSASGHGMPVYNYSTTSQTPAATTRTYLAGSKITVPVTKLQIGTTLTWTFNMTKTAAGTASSTIDVAIGTNGTTSDSAILSFTKPAGTAVADEAYCTVKVIIRGPLSGSCIATGEFTMLHNLEATGHAQIPVVVVNTVSSTFDATTASLFAGVCLTSGASDAITIQQVTAEAVGF